MGTCASYLVASKSALEVQDALQHFLGVTRPKVIYSDNADDIIREVKDLGFRGRHEFCQPGMPQTNGVAERAVQDVLDGARALMVHARLPGYFWSYVAPSYCLLRSTRAISRYAGGASVERDGSGSP